MRIPPARRRVALLGIATASVLVLSACAGAGGAGGGDSGGKVTLTLATVNNPQMKDMETLKSSFEKDNPDISIKFVQMEENDLRDSVTKDVATQGGQYDVVTVGSYEVPIWAGNEWLTDLTSLAGDDEDYDVDDLMPPIREALTVDDSLS
jgi:sorbitol/mannitol transport system substrate-binding protein